jgi:hypothetical protein
MTDEDSADHKRILDRANRMLKQSRTLRRLSDELKQESADIRWSVKHANEKNAKKAKKPTKRTRRS